MKVRLTNKLMFLTVMLLTVGISNAQISIVPSNGGGNYGTQQNSKIITVGNVSFKMIYVQGGTFQMGCKPEDNDVVKDLKNFWNNLPDSEKRERQTSYQDKLQEAQKRANYEKNHKVTLGSYYIGETEVTQALWKAVMGNNPSEYQYREPDKGPVESVSWDDCQEFIKKLNQMTGRKIRLPTESEWKFAARGGIKSMGYRCSGSNDYMQVGWFDEALMGGSTHTVKGKKCNELGIYDMSGNVSEWCNDWLDKDYYSNSPENNPQGPASGEAKCARGGAFCVRNYYVYGRNGYIKSSHHENIGLRLVLCE